MPVSESARALLKSQRHQANAGQFDLDALAQAWVADGVHLGAGQADAHELGGKKPRKWAARVFDKISPWRCDLLWFASLRGVLFGFPPSDNPLGDCRCRGAEPVRLRAQRLAGTAARAGRYSAGACGLERAAARPRRLGRIHRAAAARTHRGYSTGACGLERAAARPRRLGRVHRAADIAGHHCEDRVRRARQSRRHARPEKAVCPRLAAAVAVRSTPAARARQYRRKVPAPGCPPGLPGRRLVRRTALPHLLQSPSASRVTAGAAGFLTFIQQPARPAWYGEPIRFDTMPSQPSAQACL